MHAKENENEANFSTEFVDRSDSFDLFELFGIEPPVIEKWCPANSEFRIRNESYFCSISLLFIVLWEYLGQLRDIPSRYYRYRVGITDHNSDSLPGSPGGP